MLTSEEITSEKALDLGTVNVCKSSCNVSLPFKASIIFPAVFLPTPGIFSKRATSPLSRVSIRVEEGALLIIFTAPLGPTPSTFNKSRKKERSFSFAKPKSAKTVSVCCIHVKILASVPTGGKRSRFESGIFISHSMPLFSKKSCFGNLPVIVPVIELNIVLF